MTRDQLLARHRAVHMAIEQRDWDDPASDLDELARLVEERLGLWDEYRGLLTVRGVSRCPLTDEVVTLDVDVEGVDGLWWNADAPVRRSIRQPATLVAMVGAVDLQSAEDALPETPFPLLLGPDRPYVVRRLLEDPTTVGVVSALSVGPLRATLVAYFAPVDRRPSFEHLLWSDRSVVADDARDSTLGPWIERDRLLWIAPGDDQLELRAGSVGCPYVDLSGEDRDALVFEGILWRLDTDVDDAPLEGGA